MTAAEQALQTVESLPHGIAIAEHPTTGHQVTVYLCPDGVYRLHHLAKSWWRSEFQAAEARREAD